MKRYLQFLAAVLLAACDQKSDSSAGTTSPADANSPAASPIVSNVVVTTQTSGNFTIDARSDATTFENRSDQAATFVFKAQGQWSFAPAAQLFGPAGVNAPAPTGYVLPGANSFELVAKRGDKTYTHVGDGVELTLKPGEVISFVMNDLAGGLADNRGSIKVEWTKKQ